MAISAEAYEYLHELEKTENWTSIPDNDQRIVKLRFLFNDKKSVTVTKYNKRNKPVKATKNGTSVFFKTTKECAEFIGVQPDTVRKALERGYKSKGYSFENAEGLII